MSKLRKVQRLAEIARSNQARRVAFRKAQADEMAAGLKSIEGLVTEYVESDLKASSSTTQSLHIRRRFFSELYRTYQIQGERLNEKERLLENEIQKLGMRHRKLKLLRGLLEKRDRDHEYALRKKVEKAQIYRAPSKL